MLENTLKDGIGASIAFAGHDFALTLDPTSITPPGFDGGDSIDTTSLSNAAYKTKFPRTLMDVTDGSFTAFYDPAVVASIIAAINDNVAITITFPDETTMVVYGYLKSFEPGELVEGEAPTAECSIVVTNDNGGTETGPA